MAAQRLAQAVDLRLRRRDLAQDRQTVAVQRVTGFGQLQPARGPAHQLRARLDLQLAQLPADLRAGDAAPAAGLGQIAGVDDIDEGLDQVQVHGASIGDCQGDCRAGLNIVLRRAAIVDDDARRYSDRSIWRPCPDA